ncbi:hypothetical protein JYU34_019045 [Plutella xylostella]|uniref:Reverse transcriptase domain-containing protein n=1 Tax=Plutella xylostella TaxID=51655 RepID=A0ABQ7PZB8_PLUXY|nr:hypothetical protein JYU34_019045 [Plutella xylostella]
MSDRTQCTKIGEYVSSDLPISYGIPQGSILGPTLFIIYINDLCSLRMGGKIISYADDTAMIFEGDNWENTYKAAQLGFNAVSSWLSQNVLTLNTAKTKFLCFSIRNSTQPSSELTLIAHSSHCVSEECSCDRLDKCNIIKYLGVIVDQNLNFRSHIELLCGRVRKLIYIFKNLRHVMKPDLLKRIYYALCESLLTYCISSWGGAYKTILIHLEYAQRTILKVINFKPYRFPTIELYRSYKVLNVRQLFILATILHQHSKTPYDPVAPTKRRKNIICSQVKCNTHFSNNFLPFLGPFLYNRINGYCFIHPLNRQECKHKVKEWLLLRTYDETEDLLKPIR